MVQILVFWPSSFYIGALQKIGIAKVLLGTKPRRLGKFRGCRFCDLWESVARKKETLRRLYNGRLALATLRSESKTLEQATITISV